MANFTIDELKKTFTGKFVNIMSKGKVEISIYVAKIIYADDSVWFGYQAFQPFDLGDLGLGRLKVVELPIDLEGNIEFPFEYVVLPEDTQETYGVLYL
jgi:hypothetical protein